MALGWGIVGIGRIADERMAPAINAFGCNKLVAVVSRDQGRADAFAIKHRAKYALTSYYEMLQLSDVDVVLITTPNALHAEQAVAAARAGKHILCDKPLAMTVSDAERIVSECRSAGVKLAVNFHNRFMPCFMDTKRIIESGQIGEVIAVDADASPGARAPRPPSDWHDNPALSGLGTVNNIGVHLYDLFRFILSAEIKTVSSFFDSPAGQLEKLALSLLKFDNGVTAQININEKIPYPRNEFVIYGTKGRLTGEGLTRSRFSGELRVLTVDGETRTPYPAINAHQALLGAFCQRILNDMEPSPSGIDGLQSVRLTDAMARSARDGVHIHVSYSQV